MKLYDSRVATNERIAKIVRLISVDKLPMSLIAQRFGMTYWGVRYIWLRYGPKDMQKPGSKTQRRIARPSTLRQTSFRRRNTDAANSMDNSVKRMSKFEGKRHETAIEASS